MHSATRLRSSLLLPAVAFFYGAGLQRNTRPLRFSHSEAALSDVEKAKRVAGYKSIDDYVRSDMVVGLGTGSTAKYAVERLGAKLSSGELANIIAIPTSIATEKQARQLNIPLGE
jgi:hypothetical protein